MGKRGPKPTPKETLARRGSRHGQNRTSPVVTATAPKAPDWLTPVARACWQAITPDLEGMGVLAQIDENALARYCTLWARWRESEDSLARTGPTVELFDGEGNVRYVQQRPEVAIAATLSGQLTKIEAEFGMTPSSRSRIEVAPSATPQLAILDFIGR